MQKLLFGPAGVLGSVKTRSTVSGIERVAELGLGSMELEFVQGVRMGRDTAFTVGEVTSSRNIALTAHAPYFINLNAREPDKIEASEERILQTARIASLCGAGSIVFHVAFYLGDSPSRVYGRVRERLQQLAGQLRSEGNQVWIRPEVTGKVSQFGTLEEVIELSAEVEGVAPCIDFAHWHARTGQFNSYNEFMSMLREVENRLGRRALDNMHIHMSGISYSKRGEINHRGLAESDLNYVDLLEALRDSKAKGIVVCESPEAYREQDTLLLQELYKTIANR